LIASANHLSLSSMTALLRLAILGFFALCLSAGLLGCSVFAQTAGAVEASSHVAPTAHHAHDHHAQPADPANPPVGHAHHGDDGALGCEACDQSLVNRASATPDKALDGSSFPLPRLVVPARLQLEPPSQAVQQTDWPPGLDPPLRGLTLIQQKISLLI